MPISVLDLFTIGIGPSSSHTVGPMRAARLFVRRLSEKGLLPATGRVQTHFYGSLALTGRGHGSDKAVLLGLEGESPEEVDVDAIAARLECLRGNNRLLLDKKKEIVFMEKEDILFHPRETMPEHPNGMLFIATDISGAELDRGAYYSPGGGFVKDDRREDLTGLAAQGNDMPYRFPSPAPHYTNTTNSNTWKDFITAF